MGKKEKMSKPNMALTLKGGQDQKAKNISFWSWEKRHKGDTIKGSFIFGRRKKSREREKKEKKKRREKGRKKEKRRSKVWKFSVFVWNLSMVFV